MPEVLLDGDWSDNPWLSPPDVVVFADDFARPDGSIIGQHTPIGDLVWTKYVGGSDPGSDVVIRSGSAGPTIASSNLLVMGLVDAGTADGILIATFNAGEGNTANFLPFRFIDGSNFLQMTVISGNWVLRKRTGGTYTILVATGVPKAPGDVFTITLRGNSVIVAINGEERVNILEPDHATATRHGIGSLPTPGNADPSSTWRDISLTIPGSWS
ncbi:hypothetical protein [Microbacterium sp. 18062]|uniref:hypothetical protein n=1 Tax=Microbacterium sp. 18062 TaxID=2681410 RepID=UPI00135708FF|nr:hypothetical protein [Microbacterium sp. 18062]